MPAGVTVSPSRQNQLSQFLNTTVAAADTSCRCKHSKPQIFRNADELAFCFLASWNGVCLPPAAFKLVSVKQLYARSVGGDFLAALKVASADPNVSRF